MDTKYTLTFIASLGALVFSFLNYKRGRKFENENYLFKSKVEIYSKIQEELIKLTSSLKNHYIEVEEYIENPSEKERNLLNDKADSIDKMCNDFTDFILANSLLIPEKVFTSLSEFCSNVLNTDSLDEKIEKSTNILSEMKEAINKLIDEAERISYLLRDDLHIEQLNVSLYKRLR